MSTAAISSSAIAVKGNAPVFAMNAVMLEAIAELARRGVEPPIWRSANSPGGDEANRRVIAKYKSRVKKL